jgi:hypothetical protein
MLKGLGKATGIAVVVLIIMIAVSMAFIFGFGLLSRSTAEFRGGTGQIEKVQADPNYRIAQYDHFFDLYAAIQADEHRLKNLEEELATGPGVDRVAQLNSTIMAVKNSRIQKITQYNADAMKADTEANFLSSDLPYQIPME